MAGALPYKVDVEVPGSDLDAFAGYSNEAPPRVLCQPRVDIRSLSASESFQMMGVVSRVDTLVIMLDRRDIFPNYRIIWGDREFRIDQVIHPSPRGGRLMEVYAEEVRRARR